MATELMERPPHADPVRGVRGKPRTRYSKRRSDKTKIRVTPFPLRYPPVLGVPQTTSHGLAARRVVYLGDPVVPRAAGGAGACVGIGFRG